MVGSVSSVDLHGERLLRRPALRPGLVGIPLFVLLAAAFLFLAPPLCSPGDTARACTSFVMDTPDGHVVGTNLDLFIQADGLVVVNKRGVGKESYRTGTTGNRLKWTSEYGSVTFSLAGREFAWGGMNEAGLVVTSMELAAGEWPAPDERPALFDGGWCQYILDTCGTVEEVIGTNDFVTVHDQGKSTHYLISDASGHALAVEFLDGEFVYYTGPDMPVKAMSNMRYERALYAYEHGVVRAGAIDPPPVTTTGAPHAGSLLDHPARRQRLRGNRGRTHRAAGP